MCCEVRWKCSNMLCHRQSWRENSCRIEIQYCYNLLGVARTRWWKMSRTFAHIVFARFVFLWVIETERKSLAAGVLRSYLSKTINYHMMILNLAYIIPFAIMKRMPKLRSSSPKICDLSPKYNGSSNYCLYNQFEFKYDILRATSMYWYGDKYN